MKASVSRIKLFKACRRAYFFKYVENLEPVQKAESLQIGSNYHKLIETLYKNGGLFNVDEDYSKEQAMAAAYRKYIYPKLKVKEAEKWFEKRIGKHVLIGRVDGIADDGLIVEHKTTSEDLANGSYEFNLQWDEQVLAYMSLTGAMQVHYTVIRKPTIRKKKDESEQEFYNRMVEWYDTETESKIQMFEIYRTDKEVAEFEKGFEEICDEMENAHNLYRCQNYCTAWGRRCEYSSVCLNYDPNQMYAEFERKKKGEAL